MCATVSSTICLRRADSFAVCTRRWPGSKRPFRRTRAAAMSAGRMRTTLRSIVPGRSLASEKAQTDGHSHHQGVYRQLAARADGRQEMTGNPGDADTCGEDLRVPPGELETDRLVDTGPPGITPRAPQTGPAPAPDVAAPSACPPAPVMTLWHPTPVLRGRRALTIEDQGQSASNSSTVRPRRVRTGRPGRRGN